MTKEATYIDLSIIPTNKIELNHILKQLKQQPYNRIALDYQFKDSQIIPPKQLMNIDADPIIVHTRATLAIQHPSSLHQLNVAQTSIQTSLFAYYQIIALKPLTEKVFQTICSQYDNYDILTLDFTTKLPFMLKRNPVYEAIRRGKYFQIQYDGIFDSQRRVVCMTNIVNLIKATGGRNLLVSSHCGESSRVRSPYDVVSLMVTLGMTKEQAFVAIRNAPEEVLKNAVHRKFFKGIIKEVQSITVVKMCKKIAKHKEKIKAKITSQKEHRLENR